MLLSLDRVTVRGPRGPLVENVTLGVGRGRVHLLVGPNGAGKSTLVRAILGAVAHDGDIRFSWEKTGRIGYVPQSFDVDRTLPLTVAEFLALTRQRRPVCFGASRESRAQAARILATVGLAGLEERAMSALSGGELQRVLLANALDPAPELLLLDEPAAGLDESATRRFEELLLAARAQSGATVLMVSHDLAQVRRIGDDVTLLARTVRRSGPPAEVLRGDLASSLEANP